MTSSEKEAELYGIIKHFMKELAALLETIPKPIEREAQEIVDKSKLSNRTLIELASHEGIVKEAYKDSKGIWTWGIGVTNASGHRVLRYKDNPQPLSKVIEIFEWLVRTKYLPAVEKAFTRPLNEAQKAAALSFHYNTGGINKASWVRAFNAGDDRLAKSQFMNWSSPPEIIPRRRKERDLFFDGVWSNDGTVNVYEQVNKPSYTPRWSSLKKIRIDKELN